MEKNLSWKPHFRDVLRVLAVFGTACVASPAGAITDPAPRAEPDAATERAQHIAEVCAKTTCRTESRDVRLKMPDGIIVGVSTQLYPYDDDGTVILYPGEALQLDFAAKGDGQNDPHFVKVIDRVDTANVRGSRGSDIAAGAQDARAVFSVEFRQEADKPDMVLVSRSDLGFAVRFDTTILVPTKDGIRPGHTSSCPVMAGLVGYEHWPFPIAMLILSNFRVAPKDDHTCQ